MEETILIRKYKPEDHAEIYRIFGEGCIEHAKVGIKIGIKNPWVISYLTVFFGMGYLFSLKWGMMFLVLGILVYLISVFLCYFLYQW